MPHYRVLYSISMTVLIKSLFASIHSLDNRMLLDLEPATDSSEEDRLVQHANHVKRRCYERWRSDVEGLSLHFQSHQKIHQTHRHFGFVHPSLGQEQWARRRCLRSSKLEGKGK